MSRGWWTLTLLVARRELRERVNARSFRISTLVLVIGVACAVGIPALAGLEAAPTSLSTRLTGMAVVVLIDLLIFIYGQRITSGVVEEKSSRVVEVLLASGTERRSAWCWWARCGWCSATRFTAPRSPPPGR